MTLWFDVEDLFRFVIDVGGRTTGIQRLTLEIYRAVHEMAAGTGEVGFVRHAPGPIPFKRVAWEDIAAQFASQSGADAPEEEEAGQVGDGRRARLRRTARGWLERVPEPVRKPLVLGTVLQLQAMGELGRAGVALVLPRALAGSAPERAQPPATAAPEPAQEDVFKPGDVLLTLGSPWFREDYRTLIRWVRDIKRMRFGVLMHDLVPIRHPQWTHIGTTRVFEAWYADVLPFCDLVLANSRYTAADVEVYAREKRISLPGPVIPIPVGTGFGPQTAEPPAARRYRDHPEPGTYVLFVSTLEARKNHALVVRVWTRLVAEVRAGRRSADSVPTLVFAGREGWLVADLLQQLENTEWLGGWVRLVESPTDAALQSLYAGCLFSIYPSLHEGWGLPVTESLAAGKPCLCSNAASLPEAGGPLCRYFDPEDTESAYEAITQVLDDRPGLAAWEEQVRREFRRVPWTRTAEVILQAATQLSQPRAA